MDERTRVTSLTPSDEAFLGVDDTDDSEPALPCRARVMLGNERGARIAVAAGLRQEIVRLPPRIYHQMHGRSGSSNRYSVSRERYVSECSELIASRDEATVREAVECIESGQVGVATVELDGVAERRSEQSGYRQAWWAVARSRVPLCPRTTQVTRTTDPGSSVSDEKLTYRFPRSECVWVR